MSKLKNTKKGMAKKALSVSLVAAMLATSNVPVWAAEDLFSAGEASAEAPVEAVPEVDNTDVFDETETSTVADEAAASVTEASDLNISDIKVSESATFAKESVSVSGKIMKNDGTELTDYSFAWRVKGDSVAIYSRDVTGGNSSAMGFTPNFKDGVTTSIDWDKYVGKELELYIFKNTNDADDTKINPTVIGTTKINKLDITKATLTLDAVSKQYNGKDFYLGEDTDNGANAIHLNSFKLDGTDLNTKYFTINASGTAKNAGEKMTVTATAKADSPYSGTSKDVTFTVEAKDYAEGDLDAKVAEGLTYQYTGKTIDISTGSVSLKESSNFSGADLSNAVKSAATEDATIGNQKAVVVTLDTSKIKNFKNVPTEITISGDDANKHVAITKRDLKNNVKVFIDKEKVQKDQTLAKFIANDLILTGTEGTELNLVYDTDYTITVINPENEVETQSFGLVGTYKVTIQAKDAAGTCINGQTFEVKVAGNVIADTEYSNNYEVYYNGEEIKPSQNDFGDLTIVGKDGDKEKLQKDQWSIVGYANNTNAGEAYAIVKIGGDSTYANQTVNVPFTINPLTVSEGSVTVPKTVTYNKGYGAASDYQIPLVVTAKDPSGKIVKGLSASDYTVEYEYVDGNKSGAAKNELHDLIKATITVTNNNFKAEETIVLNNKTTEIVAKALNDSMIKINPSSYTYTGGNIIPEFYVSDGAFVLYEGKEGDTNNEYEVVSVTNNLNVGTGTVSIKGINDNYSGTASANFTITEANTADVKVEIDSQKYTGKSVRPRTFKATLNGNDVTSQFEIVSFGENVEAGTGTVVLKPVDGNKNFTGSNITAEFKIYKEIVTGNISVYDSNGLEVTGANKEFDFDGTEKTFATERLTNLLEVKADKTTGPTKATAADFEIKYAENITGVPSKDPAKNTAYVYAVAKEGTGYTGNQKITLADGTIIKDVVAVCEFSIKNVEFVEQNVSVKNAVYAGGLPVKPEVLVQIKGQTLVEGKDYKLELSGAAKGDNYNNVTDGKVYGVTVTGMGGYTGSKVTLVKPASWGIDKKDISDCDVKVTNGVVTVMNGYIPVPVTEYTSKDNGDGTYTITAETTSKNYTGSKTVASEGAKPSDKPGAPMISKVNVVGNKATVILSGDVEGASGYDYVISTDRDCITNKDYDKVNKNKVATQTTFQYVAQDVYYAYCHAWKRDENGKKVFGEWSNAYPFSVSAITPEQPGIQSVKVSGSTVTVTYTKCANATGYDIVLGSAVKKVNDEMRPVEYGTLVKKITKGTTVTATFKNVKKGTYYAGLHAYNRTSEDGKKVFSPWSNTKKVTVK